MRYIVSTAQIHFNEKHFFGEILICDKLIVYPQENNDGLNGENHTNCSVLTFVAT